MSLDVLSDDHPLAQELTSLRNAVAHYQKETYNVSLNLQRHALESANTLQQLQSSQNENAYLRKELEAYRALNAGQNAGDPRESIKIQELSLALRHLSDKLDLAEQALLTRNEELITARRDRDTAKHSQEAAYTLAIRLRNELEICRAGERNLLNRVKTAEEERRMSDLVVQEYAHLVRSLEGRTSQQASGEVRKGHVSHDSLDGLSTARAGLQKLLQEHNIESESLHFQIAQLNATLETTQATLEAERRAAAEEGKKFAITELVLNRLNADDNAAAKMVSRYMKFSQSSSDVLHKALDSMRARHAATLSSYESRVHQVEDRLAGEKRQSERLRQALDELTEDISRESYGRRREIALRLALVGREEALLERLKRWLLRAQEELRKCTPSDPADVLCARFDSIIRSAGSLVQAVSGNSDVSALTLDEQQQTLSPGSLARILSARSAVADLNSELQKETDKRLFLERQLAHLNPASLLPRVLVDKSIGAHLSDDENGLNNGHDGHDHQHVQKKPPIPPELSELPIRLAIHNAGAGSGRSPEAPPYQGETFNVHGAGTHHSLEDPSASTSTTSLTAPDEYEALVAPYSASLIKPGTSTLSVDDPGVSPINDGSLAEQIAPQRKAEIREDNSTESTHDLAAKDEKDISQPSNSMLNPETTPPQSLEVDEHAPQVTPDSDARIGGEPVEHEIVTMAIEDDQSHLRPSDASISQPANPAPSNDLITPQCETIDITLIAQNKFDPEDNVEPAELPVTMDSVQETSTSLEPDDGPSEKAMNSSIPENPDSKVSVPIDVSGRDLGIFSNENASSKNKVQFSYNTSIDTFRPTTQPNGIPEVHTPLTLLQMDRYKGQVPFPVAHSPERFTDDIAIAEDQSNYSDSAHSSLISGLNETVHRYDDLQRSFRDCHISLQHLKEAARSLPQNPAFYQVAIERLDDYCEDARVELEIRIADEERIARGYETILSVKGALSGEVDEAGMRSKIEDFIEGIDPTVRKAVNSLKHKLDDLQHDIASVKQAMHDPASLDASQEAREVPESPRRASSSWAAWTGSILTGSRSPSPASPATFGTVMTSPRLRHSSSFVRNRSDSNPSQSPLASLGLRIAMPSQLQTMPAPVNPLHRGGPRPRVSSNMFGLGIGGGLLPGSRRTSMANANTGASKIHPSVSVNLDDDLD